MEALETFLDEAGVGHGRVTLTPIGDGHSNLTYALRRGAERFVLRRPPHGPLPPSAHDVLREARLMAALGPTAIPVPEVLAVCDRDDVIGAPFYVTTGDPLADLGYLTATWADPDDPPNPMLDLSAVTRLAGFPDRATLARRYAERTGRDLSQLRWYQTLALWKSAIFLEGSYRRFRTGMTDDPFFAALEHGVPALASAAARSRL